jgi:hypothetical protein
LLGSLLDAIGVLTSEARLGGNSVLLLEYQPVAVEGWRPALQDQDGELECAATASLRRRHTTSAATATRTSHAARHAVASRGVGRSRPQRRRYRRAGHARLAPALDALANTFDIDRYRWALLGWHRRVLLGLAQLGRQPDATSGNQVKSCTLTGRTRKTIIAQEVIESMLPSDTDCPHRILRLLSSTDDPHASEWRQRCRGRWRRRGAETGTRH